jgi:single-stranded DNA-binding protein
VNDPKLIGNPDSPNRIVLFTISNKRGKKGKEFTNYFNCVAFATLADMIYSSCEKGDMIGIDGEWRQKDFVDKKTGVTKEGLEIVAWSVQFFPRKHYQRERQEDFFPKNNFTSQ